MEQAIEIVAAIWLFGVGLSHLVQAQAWVEFFTRLRQKVRRPSGAAAALRNLVGDDGTNAGHGIG